VDLEISDIDDVAMAAEKLQAIAETADNAGIEVDGHHVRGRVRRAGRATPGLLRDLEQSGITLDSIEVHRLTLDDVFLTLTGRSLREAEEAADASDAGPGTDEELETTGAER